MTKQEFLDYIKSFGKSPGEYTDDEIFDIGVVHKTKLHITDRSWSELADLLGTAANGLDTGERYRKKVVYWESRVRKHSGETIDEPDTLGGAHDVIHGQSQINKISDRDELFKLRQQLRDLRNSYLRVLRDEARIDAFKHSVQDAARMFEKLPAVKYEGSKRGLTTEAILLFSDLHIGAEIGNTVNTYNNQIAKARVEKLVSDVVHYCKLNKVRKLNFINLGDLIHGIIHISLRVELEMDVIQQVMVASELLSYALHELSKHVPEIIYRSSTDNHARVSPNKSEAIEKENLGRLIDWFVEERLKNTNIVFAKDNIEPDIGAFYLDSGHLVVFSHGHNDPIGSAVKNFVGVTRQYVDYVLLGHYHSEKTFNVQDSKVIVNGSIIGPDSYAMSKRLITAPSQTLLVFDDENTISYSINLNIQQVE